jgi:asparagine synthetase B (glutamine-hydrolysing)
LDELIKCQEIPFGSTNIYAQHRVFRLIKENNIKVVLDGQGADELLEGITKYIFREALKEITPKPILQRKDKIAFTPHEKRYLFKMKNQIISLLNNNSLPFFDYNYIKQNYIKKLETPDNLDFTLWRIINTINWLDLFNIYII